MPEPVSNKRLPYRRDIDGLRAIAVLSVFAFHVSPDRIRGGFVGVDIFFVISGFLISSILYSELESNAFSIPGFYVRRIRRIYPALFVVLLAVAVAGWFLLLPTEFVRLGKQIMGGSAFVANFVLWWQSGYFSADSARIPLLHLWSLGVEEQYYLIFPLICMAFYRAKSRWALPVSFIVIGLLSMAINVAFVRRYSEACFFLPFSRLWELFLGAGLSLCLHRNLQAAWERKFLARWRTVVGLLGLIMIVLSVLVIDQYDLFPGWWALLPTIGTVLVIAAGESAWSNRHILSSKPAVFVGLISYPLYLWHWPVLSFMRIVQASWGFEISHFREAAMIVLAFVLAYLTYRFIELPIRQVRQRDQRRRGALQLIGCVSLMGVFGAFVVLYGGLPNRQPAAVVALDHDYAAMASEAWHEGNCFLQLGQSAASFGAKCADPRQESASLPFVLVWGDSHAADLMPGLRSLQSQPAVRLAQYTASGCIPIVGLELREQRECASINDAVIGQIRKLKPDIVVLSGQWDWHFQHDPGISTDELRKTIGLVKASGVGRVVVIGSAPEWKSEVPDMLISEVRRHPNAPLSGRLSRGLLKFHDDTVLEAATQQMGAIYISLFENLCDQTSCVVGTGPSWQQVITMDTAHFTGYGSTLVARRIWPSIIGSENPSLATGIPTVNLVHPVQDAQ
jgi:peptidoglycan/LPS O-acetylase OafA/YrhL